MGTPDPHTTGNVIDAIKYAAGGVIGAGVAAFAKNFFTASGTDARELRQEYRDEVKRLRELRTADQEEIEELRDDVRNLRGALEELRALCEKQAFEFRQQVESLTIRSQKLLIERTEARALLNARERLDGAPLTPWPPDDPLPIQPRFIDPDDLQGGT